MHVDREKIEPLLRQYWTDRAEDTGKFVYSLQDISELLNTDGFLNASVANIKKWRKLWNLPSRNFTALEKRQWAVVHSSDSALTVDHGKNGPPPMDRVRRQLRKDHRHDSTRSTRTVSGRKRTRQIRSIDTPSDKLSWQSFEGDHHTDHTDIASSASGSCDFASQSPQSSASAHDNLQTGEENPISDTQPCRLVQASIPMTCQTTFFDSNDLSTQRVDGFGRLASNLAPHQDFLVIPSQSLPPTTKPLRSCQQKYTELGLTRVSAELLDLMPHARSELAYPWPYEPIYDEQDTERAATVQTHTPKQYVCVLSDDNQNSSPPAGPERSIPIHLDQAVRAAQQFVCKWQSKSVFHLLPGPWNWTMNDPSPPSQAQFVRPWRAYSKIYGAVELLQLNLGQFARDWLQEGMTDLLESCRRPSPRLLSNIVLIGFNCISTCPEEGRDYLIEMIQSMISRAREDGIHEQWPELLQFIQVIFQLNTADRHAKTQLILQLRNILSTHCANEFEADYELSEQLIRLRLEGNDWLGAQDEITDLRAIITSFCRAR